MTVYEMTDVARLRLEDISFFGFLLLLATLGIRFLWNYVDKGFEFRNLTELEQTLAEMDAKYPVKVSE